MNNYDIIDEFGFEYPHVLKDVINRTLELENVTNSVFSIVFVDDKKIQEINKTYRNKDSVTDVISFAFEDSGFATNDIRVLGDIFICIPKMKQQSIDYNHSEVREICFLTVHGLLHLLGYDHMNEIDEKIMFDKQEMILNENEATKR